MGYAGLWFCAGWLLCGATAAQAAEDERLAAIKELGELNGIALNCGRLEETRRMKQALVAILPKRRQLGDLFDYETNRAFMESIQAHRPCPATADLHEQVEQAIHALEQAYAAPSN
jgi:hypothetical protein